MVNGMRNACVLPKMISALRIVDAGESGTATRVFTQLPQDSVIWVCGAGFNDRIVKVQSGPICYFVFKEDIVAAGIMAPPLWRNSELTIRSQGRGRPLLQRVTPLRSGPGSYPVESNSQVIGFLLILCTQWQDQESCFMIILSKLTVGTESGLL